MGWDIQINPTAEAVSITGDLAELLEDHATEFAMKYCYVEGGPRLIARLRAYRPVTDGEASVVARLIYELETADIVELILGN